MKELNLEGRTAVITGASRGLGAGLAEVFAGSGLQLGLCSRTKPALADGSAVLAREVDVRDEASIEAFAQEVEERFGAIALWINNAGVLAPIKPLRDISVAEFRDHIDINLSGVFLGTRAYVHHVRRREGGGVLINISSGAAWGGYAGWSAYCAGKAGVALLTQCVALEEADAGLRAHAVAPGIIDTDMQALIRSSRADDFPAVERFIEAKKSDAFNTSEFVARHLLALAFDPGYPNDEVDVRLPDEKG
jgi:NAD(P)-dependent dehydrogenase (short-subunit alcohol dehydrogenase family)